MIIAGFVKNSFVDYPGKIASVVFTQGCNMNCFFCHNKQLIDKNSICIDIKEVFEHLKKRMEFIEAVVITGGEPTIHNTLISFIKRIKKMGYLVKLDTNGTNPVMIKYLIDNVLIDYCAMDIKSTFKHYDNICGTKVNIRNIKSTIKILMESKIKYEFRTTCYPKITEGDIFDIANAIKGADCYALQKYRKPYDNRNYNCSGDLRLPVIGNLELSKMVGKIEYRGI